MERRSIAWPILSAVFSEVLKGIADLPWVRIEELKVAIMEEWSEDRVRLDETAMGSASIPLVVKKSSRLGVLFLSNGQWVSSPIDRCLKFLSCRTPLKLYHFMLTSCIPQLGCFKQIYDLVIWKSPWTRPQTIDSLNSYLAFSVFYYNCCRLGFCWLIVTYFLWDCHTVIWVFSVINSKIWLFWNNFFQWNECQFQYNIQFIVINEWAAFLMVI